MNGKSFLINRNHSNMHSWNLLLTNIFKNKNDHFFKLHNLYCLNFFYILFSIRCPTPVNGRPPSTRNRTSDVIILGYRKAQIQSQSTIKSYIKLTLPHWSLTNNEPAGIPFFYLLGYSDNCRMYDIWFPMLPHPPLHQHDQNYKNIHQNP